MSKTELRGLSQALGWVHINACMRRNYARIGEYQKTIRGITCKGHKGPVIFPITTNQSGW